MLDSVSTESAFDAFDDTEVADDFLFRRRNIVSQQFQSLLPYSFLSGITRRANDVDIANNYDLTATGDIKNTSELV